MSKKSESTKRSNIQVNTFILVIGLLLITIGICFALAKSPNAYAYTILISIGCSVLSTAIVNISNSVYQTQQNRALKTIQTWGIDEIYEARSEINPETNELLKRTTSLEICAMGLSSLRDAQGDEIKKRISKGMNLKILTLDPNCPFLKDIDKAENRTENYTKQSIEQLILWLSDLKQYEKYEDQIEIRTYNTYPHDFYYCMDGIVFMGPYLPKSSQQTITYKYLANSKGAIYYQNHFSKLWSNACKKPI